MFKKSNLMTVICFAVMTASLTAASIFHPVKTASETENRSLAQMPEFSFHELVFGNFIHDYESYVTDQFVARDMWISVKTASERLLGKKEASGVYFASDGYFIENTKPDSEQQSKNIGYLTAFADSMTAASQNLRILIAPTASLIYADKLPSYAPIWNQSELLDSLSVLNGFVDTREILTSHSKTTQLYYRTDHHWTTKGAYYAYTELCQSLNIVPLSESEIREWVLSDEFLGTTIAKVGIRTTPDILTTIESDSQPKLTLNYNFGAMTTDSIYVSDKLSTRDKYGVFFGGNYGVVDITTDSASDRTLLMVKDSYAHCMIPLLCNHYRRLILIDLRETQLGVMSYLQKLSEEGVTVDDIVILYNASNFVEDRNLVKLNK